MASTGARTDLELITVHLDGNPIAGNWDMFTGGDIDSVELRHRPGGQPYEVQQGGPITVTNFTVSREFRTERDLPILPELRNRVGKGQITCARQRVDANYKEIGESSVYTGVLKTVKPAETDSDKPAIAMLALEISPDGAVS